MNAGKKIVRLTQSQFLQVAMVMQGELKEWIVSKRPPYTEVARIVSEKLKIYVTDTAIVRANKLLNLYLPVTAERDQKSKQKSKEEKSKFEYVENRLNHLEMLVGHLYKELGVRAPTCPTECA